jgi:hypothetical protein
MSSTNALQFGLVPVQDRVREHTAGPVNERIDRLTQANVQATLAQGRDGILRRMAELDEEWDVDRALMVNFAVAGGLTFSAGLARYANASPFAPRPKGFLYFFGAQLGFLFLHGLVGWCPPLVVFRRLGFRTKSEIEAERLHLLRALDGLAA